MKKTFSKFLVIGSSAVVFGIALIAANNANLHIGHEKPETVTLSSVASHTTGAYDNINERSFAENLSLAGKVVGMAIKGLGSNLQNSGDELTQYSDVNTADGKHQAVKLSNSVGKIDITEDFANHVKADRAKRIEEEKKNRKEPTVSVAAATATQGALGQIIKPKDMEQLQKLKTRVEQDAKILSQNKNLNKQESLKNMETIRKAALEDLSVDANPGAYVVSKQ